MKFIDLYVRISLDTDVNVVRDGYIIKKIKRGTYWEDVDYDIRISSVEKITAADFRTIEVTIH